jgi:hypothetical protein
MQDALGRQIKANNETTRAGDIVYSLQPKKIKDIIFYQKNIRYILYSLPHVSFAESEIKPWKEIEISDKMKEKIKKLNLTLK